MCIRDRPRATAEGGPPHDEGRAQPIGAAGPRVSQHDLPGDVVERMRALRAEMGGTNAEILRAALDLLEAARRKGAA